ncbi:MAG: type II and III secretion system protein family protein [Alphaproteobacteria bacterium]|nr:type II and III secretion system protein family protein [Alphaproteobacteria bacterium]
MKRTHALSALAFLALAFALLPATPACAGSKVLSVTVDEGVPLKLSAPAASVFIANPSIADIQVMSPREIMVFGKRTGETTFMATGNDGSTLSDRTVVVSQDLSGLRTELNSAIPGNHIHAKAVPNGIVLTGTAKNAAAVADAYKIAMRYMPTGGDIINRVQVNGSNQVQIRVRFAEVARSVDNSLGFNWQNLGTLGGGMAVGLATGASGLGTGSTLLGTRPNNTSLSLPNDLLGASLNSGRWSVTALIDALAQNGLITILAEPNLTAMSGETANFLAGGEFPIPVPQANGTISITFKSYGVSLSFTPTIIGGNRINLHVRPEVSELTQTGSIVINNITVPALLTRKAETTVEVASGQSFAIAGLLDNNQAQTVNKFPVLGDLPILGQLFRDNHFVNGQTELVVIITPYIVKPSGQRLTLPTDGLAPPNETERLIGMRYSNSDPHARPISGEPDAVAAPPAAAPVAPVTESPMPKTAPSVSNLHLAPRPQSDHTEAAPAVSLSTQPVVLHPAGDGKGSGGLLVE